MAEGREEVPNGASWWGSWYSSAKAKTSTVFEAVKKDLDELSTAVKTEASYVGAAIENTLKFDEEDSTVGTVKKSISTFFGQVTEALIPSLEDDETEAVLITHDGTVTLTGFQKHLADLQKNDKTYLEAPKDELIEKYKMWMEVIDQDQFTQNRLARHLASSEILNEKYVTLVPEKLPHMEFWQRYLFKRALLEDALANAEIAERKAKIEIDSTTPVSPRKNIVQTEQPKLACSENDKEEKTDSPEKEHSKSLDKELSEDDINWDAEEIPSNVELTEEEQTRLLEQYEQEIQEREKRKSIILNDPTAIEEPKKPTPKSSPEKKPQQNKKSDKNNGKQPAVDSKKKQQTQQKNTSVKQTDNKPANAKPTKQNQSKKESSLKVDKDHFNKDEISSSTSDESWEKDFDMNE